MVKSYLLEDVINNLEDLIVIKQAILDRIVPQDAEACLLIFLILAS